MSVTGVPVARDTPGKPYSVHGTLLRFLKTRATSTEPAVPWVSPIEPLRYRVRQPAAAGRVVGCDAGDAFAAGPVVAGRLADEVTVTVLVGRAGGEPPPHAA